MTERTLTRDEAFLAMFAFLENYYNTTKSDEIGSILSSLSLLPDGRTADPAMTDEWNEAVESALKGHVDAKLSFS